jgi:epoxide hydrolase
MDDEITPFRVEIPDADLDALRERLANSRWPDELPDAGHDYGAPLDTIGPLARYWGDGYEWRQHEAQLNALPHFTTVIDGATVHFLHLRSPEPGAFPLLLTHGWPGSFVEFLDVIGPLSDPAGHGHDRADAFDLVIPSIPGFGFSGPTRERGWDVARIAKAWVELMSRLGYHRYGTQGGDWGSAISRAVAAAVPDRVAGVHVNYLVTPPSPAGPELTPEEGSRLAKVQEYLARPAGYWRIQATRPQTLAYALTDSPLGLLAWIGEKFFEWTDPTVRVDVDRILTNVTIYWLTATAGSSARLYYEATKTRGGPQPVAAPMGVAVFPHDIVLPVRALAEATYSIKRWTEYSQGGHFPALEVPDLFVDDVRAFFRPLR